MSKVSQDCKKPAIIIDNGSYETRAGWSFNSEEGPYCRFRSISSKPKNLAGTGGLTKGMLDMTMIGNELIDFDLSREGASKSAFDRNVII